MRLGGLVLIRIGTVLVVLGSAPAMAILGRPIPDASLVRDVVPYLRQIAAKVAIPPGSELPALFASGFGIAAVAAIGAGALLGLAGLWKVLTGRRGAVILVTVVAMVCGFAAAMALARARVSPGRAGCVRRRRPWQARRQVS